MPPSNVIGTFRTGKFEEFRVTLRTVLANVIVVTLAFGTDSLFTSVMQ